MRRYPANFPLSSVFKTKIDMLIRLLDMKIWLAKPFFCSIFLMLLLLQRRCLHMMLPGTALRVESCSQVNIFANNFVESYLVRMIVLHDRKPLIGSWNCKIKLFSSQRNQSFDADCFILLSFQTIHIRNCARISLDPPVKHLLNQSPPNRLQQHQEVLR